MINANLPPIPDSVMAKGKEMADFLMNPEPYLMQKLEKIYEYLDCFEEYISKFASCKKGCSHCCCIDIQISIYEVEYICSKTGISYTNEIPFSQGHKTPCPFLASNVCSIYSVRPLVCRFYHVMGDPEDCKTGRLQLQYGSPAANYSNNAYRNIIHWVHHQSRLVAGEEGFKDIRNFFN